MRSKGFEGMACSIADVMGAIGDRWGVLILRDLLLGLTRYDDLRQSTGVTNATLSTRLKELEQSGLVERREYQTRPVRHEYMPTEKGRDLALLMLALVQIGDKWRQSDRQAAPLRFVDAHSGKDVRLAIVASTLALDIETPELSIMPGPAADNLMQWRIVQGANERAKRSRAPISTKRTP